MGARSSKMIGRKAVSSASPLAEVATRAGRSSALPLPCRVLAVGSAVKTRVDLRVWDFFEDHPDQDQK